MVAQFLRRQLKAVDTQSSCQPSLLSPSVSRMAPSKKSLDLAKKLPARQTRSRAKLMAERVQQKSKGPGSDPSRPRLIDSDDDDVRPLAASVNKEVTHPVLVPYSDDEDEVMPEKSDPPIPAVQEDERMQTSLEKEAPISSETRSVQSLSSERTASNSSDDESPEVTVFPPLPEIKVSLSEFLNNAPYDVFDRKAACQYGQSLLEQQNPTYWNPPKAPFSEKFFEESGMLRFNQLKKGHIFEERVVLATRPENTELRRILRRSNLLSLVEDLESYVRPVVLEFYSNFVPVEDNEHDISLVFLRGKLYEFSPRMINHVFGLEDYPCLGDHDLALGQGVSNNRMTRELTEGTIPNWTGFKTTFLPRLLKALYRLCGFNWLPTSNRSYVALERAQMCYKIWKGIPFNLGRVVYKQIAEIAATPDSKNDDKRKLLPFPSLIYRVLEFQRVVPLAQNEDRESGPREFKVEQEKRVQTDGAGSSSDFQFGKSMLADARKLTQLMTEFRDRLESGDYSSQESEDF